MGRFLALFTELPMDEVRRLAALEGAELNAAKVVLADEATRLAHGAAAAQAAGAAARDVFAQAAASDGLPTVAIADPRATLADVAVLAGLAASRGAAQRLAAGGGLRLDGVAVTNAALPLTAGASEWLLSAGRRRHVRILLQA